jgi:hypothetical protein
MAFALCSDITIGNYKRVKPHEVKIAKSIFDYVDKATIKLPITSRIVRSGEVITASAESPKIFSEGDKVLIQLGYNGQLKKEFEGFVSRVNFKTPVELECEGYSYQLRQNNYLKTFYKTDLSTIMKFLVADTDIVLKTNLDKKKGFIIDKLQFDNNSGTECLEKIKKESAGLIKFFFTGNELWYGLQYDQVKADVKYLLGWNVIKDDSLKLRQANNQDVTVNFIGEKKDGTKVKVIVNGKKRTKDNVLKTSGSAGKTGETIIIKTHSIVDKNALDLMAAAKHRQLTYDGYEGKITAFGAPYCEPGYAAVITDNKYNERSGRYITESVEVSYGMQGFRRVVGIGAKL